MAAFTATPRNEMLEWLVGKADPAPVAATRYISIYNGDPQGAGSEVISTVTGSANRVDLTTAMGAAAAAGSISSNADITFTTNASGAATVNYVSIHDAQTAGNLMGSAAVTSKSITAGDSLKILSGNATFSIA